MMIFTNLSSSLLCAWLLNRRAKASQSLVRLGKEEMEGKKDISSMLVSQHRKTLTIEELSYHELLLNRESNPGLPRLVIN